MTFGSRRQWRVLTPQPDDQRDRDEPNDRELANFLLVPREGGELLLERLDLQELLGVLRSLVSKRPDSTICRVHDEMLGPLLCWMLPITTAGSGYAQDDGDDCSWSDARTRELASFGELPVRLHEWGGRGDLLIDH